MGTTNLFGLQPIDYVDNSKNTAGPITFGTNKMCDSNWVAPIPVTTTTSAGTVTTQATSTGCYGMAAPWGFSKITDYAAASGSLSEVKGSVRAWHWLADKDADRTTVWAVEKDDTLNILVYEMIDKNAVSPANVWTAESYHWYAKTVKVAGAMSLISGTCLTYLLMF